MNLVHGAGSAGAFIYLVQAEIVAALSHLSRGSTANGYHAVPDADRRLIAELWMSQFSKDSHR